MAKSKKKRAKKRNTHEMLAVKQAEIKALEAKAALEAVKDHPAMKTLETTLKGLNKRIIEFQKGFGKGPQSFEARKRGHQLWIDVIEAEAAVASIGVSELVHQRDYLKGEMTMLADTIVKGECDGSDYLEVILDNMPVSDNETLQKAKANLATAQFNREGFTNSKKQTQKKQKAKEANK